MKRLGRILALAGLLTAATVDTPVVDARKDVRQELFKVTRSVDEVELNTYGEQQDKQQIIIRGTVDDMEKVVTLLRVKGEVAVVRTREAIYLIFIQDYPDKFAASAAHYLPGKNTYKVKKLFENNTPNNPYPDQP